MAAGDEIEIWLEGALSGPDRAVTANLDASAVNAASASTLTTIPLENRTGLDVNTTVTVDAQNLFLYTIQVRNLGPDDATNVQVTHAVEEQMTITATGPECTVSGSSALCKFGTIPAFESRTTTVRARGGALAADRTAITTATANEVLSRDPTTFTTARSGGAPAADLRIHLTSSELVASRPVLVEVVNQGPSDADGVEITLTPPPGIGLTEAPPPFCERSLQVTCRIGRLAVGRRWQQSFFFQVPATPAVLLGRVGATTPDPRGADNSQSVDIRTARQIAQGYPDAGAVSSSAAYQPGATVPGSDPSIFGTGMTERTTVPAAVPLPLQLDGISVTLNGVPAPLIFVSPTQVNFQTPWELLGESTAQVVMRIGDTLWPVGRVQVRPAAPEIFTMSQTGSGQGAILIANTASLAAPAAAYPGSRPVRRGEFVSIFCIGLGPVDDPPLSGAPALAERLARTRHPVQTTMGGVAATVSYSGLAPGFVGLYQVNAQVPETVSAGPAVPVVLEVLGARSNSVTIAVD
jgi:uncharacterized protein (TIGR03437 family)